MTDPAPASDPRLRAQRRGHLALLLAALLGPALILAYFNRNSGFVWDDIKNFRQAQVEGLSFSHLGQPTSGHFAPGHRLGDWFLQHFFPFNFGVSQLLLLALFVLSLVVFYKILTDLFRPGPGPVVVTLLYGVANTHVGVTQWWAAGLDRLPATVFTFIAVLGYLRWFRTRSRAWLAVSVLAVPAGLLFYVKPVFVPGYLVLIRVLLLEPDRPLRETLAAALSEWKVWLLYALPTAISAYIYASMYPTELNHEPTVSVFLGYLGNLWFRVMAPGFLGLFVPQVNYSWVATVGVIVSQAAVVGFLAWTLWRRPGAGRAWLFFAAGFTVNAVIVGLTRIGDFPARVIAYTTYFNLESTYLFFLAMAFIFLRRRSWWPRASEPGATPELPPLNLLGQGLGIGALALYVGLSASAAHQLNDPGVWAGAQARDYTDTVAGSVNRLQASGRPFALVDGLVPSSVMPAFLAPYNGVSEVVSVFEPDVKFDPEGRDLYSVDVDGTFLPVTLTEDAGGTAKALVDEGRLHWINAKERFDGERVCFRSGNVNAGIGYTLPKSITGSLYAALRYSTTGYFDFSLIPEPIGGNPPPGPGPFRPLRLRPNGEQAGVFPLPQPTMQQLVMILGAHSEVCLHHLEVGRLEAGA